MPKTVDYRNALVSTANWDEYLLEHSGLPGPRANLELMYAVAELANEDLLQQYCDIPKEKAPVNSPQVFLCCCGILGLGRLVREGKNQYLDKLRSFASDERWRVREATAMGLQLVGDKDINFLLSQMHAWQTGNLLEKRAVVAALCEPRLLKNREVTERVLSILNDITEELRTVQDRKSDAFLVLKKALSYGWSVAVVSNPGPGKELMEVWLQNEDKDIQGVMKENLHKNRLVKLDPVWVAEQQSKLEVLSFRSRRNK